MTAEAAPAARLEACAAQALEAARAAGADAAKVVLDRGEGRLVGVRLGELETIEHEREQQFSVRAYYGRRSGAAGSTDLSPDAVARTVAAACAIARQTEEDPAHGLPARDWLAFEYPDLDLEHPWDLEPEAAAGIALECEAAARADARIANSEGARLATYSGVHLIANSLGFLGRYPRSQHSLSCCVIAAAGDGAQERDHWWSAACDWRRLEEPAAVGRAAAARAARRLGARPLKSCSAPVLFDAPLAGSLLGHFAAAASGPALYRQASFLLGRLGEPLWPRGFRLVERPLEAGGVASAPFDADGVRTRERAVVDDGVLREWFLGTYAARRLGLEPTGNAGGVRNLVLETDGEELPPEALLPRLHRGLWVTELLGQGVNPVTGDYSRGAAGFWVENGEIAHPVHEITIAGALPDMYRGVAAVGADRDRRGSMQSGSLLIERMQIAGA